MMVEGGGERVKALGGKKKKKKKRKGEKKWVLLVLVGWGKS